MTTTRKYYLKLPNIHRVVSDVLESEQENGNPVRDRSLFYDGQACSGWYTFGMYDAYDIRNRLDRGIWVEITKCKFKKWCREHKIIYDPEARCTREE